MDLIHELHTGQRRVNSRTKRPDTRKHLDYALYLLRIFLRKPGRPHTAPGASAPLWRLTPAKEIPKLFSPNVRRHIRH